MVTGINVDCVNNPGPYPAGTNNNPTYYYCNWWQTIPTQDTWAIVRQSNQVQEKPEHNPMGYHNISYRFREGAIFEQGYERNC